jgi:nucleotide-binding universal stress UspA family protein
MYRHLLVPTDATEISTENVTAVVDFARSIGAPITYAEGATLLHVLSDEVEAWERGQPKSPEPLREALETFATAQWRHMKRRKRSSSPRRAST